MKNCNNGGLNKSPKKTDTWYGETADYVEEQSQSALLSILRLVLFRNKDIPFSAALLKHYVEGSWSPLNLNDIAEIPQQWKDLIVKKTGGRIGKHNIDPYNSGIFDLRHSIGHFDVTVTKISNTQNRYEISDLYVFAPKKNDIDQTGRHGFSFGHVDDFLVSLASSILPEETYCNPGGFSEKWEIRQVGSETILFIPQEFLAKHGIPFKVHGGFTQ